MSTHQNPDPIDGAQIVHRHWSLDGPHSPESVVAAADAVAELNRYLARATWSGRNVLPYAHDGYRVVGSLRAAAISQAQVYRQLGTWAESLADDRGLRDDEHHDQKRAVEQARTAAAHLRATEPRLFELDRQLDRAQAPLSHLYHELDRGLDR